MKKIISLFLVLALSTAVFAACSKDAEKSEQKEETDAVSITVDSHYEDFDESAVNAYEKICQAIMNGDEQVNFNMLQLENVNQLYYTSFPLSSLVESIEILSDNSGYQIKYKNSLEEHKKLVDEFDSMILSIKEECGYSQVSTDNYIFNVYTYITKNFTADSSVLTPYDALVQKKGYSSAINALFEYLVLQGGGKACHVVGNGEASFISLVQFEGKWYYFDAYSEIEDNQGKALKFFAMSDTSLNATYSYTDGEKVTETGDGAFDKLRQSQSFEINGTKVTAALSDGNSFEIDLA